MTARQWMLLIWIFLIAVIARAAEPDELFKAIEARDVARVDALLEANPSLVNATTARGDSAVTTALFVNDHGFMKANHNEVLRAIVLHKPSLDLHETAAIGSAADLAAMLTKDNVMMRNRFGWTPLHHAAFAGNVETAKLLLDRGADVNARAKTKFLNTPLLAASLTGQVEVARLLLDRGADVLVRQSQGFTPLHEAALIGNMELVRLYIDRGAELNSRTDDGRTPLSEAMRGKHQEIVEFLKVKGAVAGIVGDKILESPE
jgi:ankyrin repeat protein